MFVWVPVAVVMSGAALEASANELLQDIIDGKTALPPLETKSNEKLSKLLSATSGNAVSRYSTIAELFHRSPPYTEEWWQNAGDRKALLRANASRRAVSFQVGKRSRSAADLRLWNGLKRKRSRQNRFRWPRRLSALGRPPEKPLWPS